MPFRRLRAGVIASVSLLAAARAGAQEARAQSVPGRTVAVERLPVPEISTVIFDLDTAGVDLGGQTTTVLLTGDRQRVRWTKPGSNSAFLVLDATALRAGGWTVLSPSRTVLNGPHLFRTGLRLIAPDDTEIVLTDGWQLFTLLDGNRDGRLDSKDPEFRFLRLFIDDNANGVMDEGELTYIRDAGVVSIPRVRRPKPHTDIYMNVTLSATFLGADGRSRQLVDARLADADAAPFADAFEP